MKIPETSFNSLFGAYWDWKQDVNPMYIRRSEDVQDIFLYTFNLRSCVQESGFDFGD